MLENFIYAKQKSLFEEALNNGKVLNEAIAFIEDTKEIWNHGTYFATQLSIDEIENIVSSSETVQSVMEQVVLDTLDSLPVSIVSDGDGSKFLSDDGTYKEIVIPTKVSDLEDDISVVTLNDSTPLVESLVGDELIPIKQDGENKAVRADELVKGGKEIFILTPDMFVETATVAGQPSTLTFTDEGWSDFIEAVEANKIIALDSNVCGTVILQATPMATNIVLTGYFILAGLSYYPTEGLVNGFLSWVSQTEDSPAAYVIIFSNKNVTSSVINTPSEIYYLDPNTYSTSEDFNNLKAAIEANKIVVININYIPTIAIPFTVDDYQIGLSFSGAIPDHFNVEDCLLQYGGYTCKFDGTITDITGDGANVLFLKNSGDGTKFLADDGTYKTIDIASILSRLDALEGK